MFLHYVDSHNSLISWSQLKVLLALVSFLLDALGRRYSQEFVAFGFICHWGPHYTENIG